MRVSGSTADIYLQLQIVILFMYIQLRIYSPGSRQASKGFVSLRSEMSSSIWWQPCEPTVNVQDSAAGIALYIFHSESWICNTAPSYEGIQYIKRIWCTHCAARCHSQGHTSSLHQGCHAITRNKWKACSILRGGGQNRQGGVLLNLTKRILKTCVMTYRRVLLIFFFKNHIPAVYFHVSSCPCWEISRVQIFHFGGIFPLGQISGLKSKTPGDIVAHISLFGHLPHTTCLFHFTHFLVMLFFFPDL